MHREKKEEGKERVRKRESQQCARIRDIYTESKGIDGRRRESEREVHERREGVEGRRDVCQDGEERKRGAVYISNTHKKGKAEKK